MVAVTSVTGTWLRCAHGRGLGYNSRLLAQQFLSTKLISRTTALIVAAADLVTKFSALEFHQYNTMVELISSLALAQAEIEVALHPLRAN
eukprot:SAG31_NODE_2348_length_5895_cov_69.747930_2_plen_90_part_00